MSDELRVIEAAVFRYARQHGASHSLADDIADSIVRRTRAATKHGITKAGFAPERWKS